jgi:hypothetical protein
MGAVDAMGGMTVFEWAGVSRPGCFFGMKMTREARRQTT